MHHTREFVSGLVANAREKLHMCTHYTRSKQPLQSIMEHGNNAEALLYWTKLFGEGRKTQNGYSIHTKTLRVMRQMIDCSQQGRPGEECCFFEATSSPEVQACRT